MTTLRDGGRDQLQPVPRTKLVIEQARCVVSLQQSDQSVIKIIRPFQLEAFTMKRIEHTMRQAKLKPVVINQEDSAQHGVS